MMTDLAPHQQCAPIIVRLQGQAREIANTLTPMEIAMGAVRDGAYIDPVSNLLFLLASRFAPFEDEERNEVMFSVWEIQQKTQ